MKSNKYITYKKKGKSDIINPQFFRRNINEAKKLYDPEFGDINKPKIPIHKVKQNSYNVSSTKNYLQFKQILNNYMNDYEKLRRQNKIPKYPEINYNFQEFEQTKNNVRELLDTFMDINGKDEFSDTNKIINNLPEDYGDMFLRNEETKNDYDLRYKIISGQAKFDIQDEKENENEEYQDNIQDNQDNNKLNENCFIENNEEEEEAENEQEDNNNINNNKQTSDDNEMKEDNLADKNEIKDNNIKTNKEKEENNINENNNKNEYNLNKKESLLVNSDIDEVNIKCKEKSKTEDLEEKNKSVDLNEIAVKKDYDKNNYVIQEEQKENNTSDNKLENNDKNISDNNNIINNDNNKEEKEEEKEEIRPNKAERLKESENYEEFDEGDFSGEQKEKSGGEEKYDDFE